MYPEFNSHFHAMQQENIDEHIFNNKLYKF